MKRSQSLLVRSEPPKNHPSTMKSRYKAAVGLIAKSFIKNVNPDKAVRPDAAIPARDAAWTWLAFDHVNSALVTTTDGNGVAWLKRDNKRFRKSMLEGYRLTRRIHEELEALGCPISVLWDCFHGNMGAYLWR
ncbi:MAG: hypothetical protein V9G11_01600 [Bifidobacterium adolescentis]